MPGEIVQEYQFLAPFQLPKFPLCELSDHFCSSTSNDVTVNLDQFERSARVVLNQFLTCYPDSTHPGAQQLRQLSVLLKDPVFREIYKFNCENKELFKPTVPPQQSKSISLPDNFYRVHFPARPGSSWGFSVGGVELERDPNEVSTPTHEQVCKLVVDSVEAAAVDRKEAHLRMLIRPGDELVLINDCVIQNPKHFKTITSKLAGRHQPVEFVFEQNLLNESQLHKSVIRFQQQKLTISLETNEIGGSFGFAIVTLDTLTVVEKIVENGIAWKDGNLRKGDIIQAISNVPIHGLNSNEVVTILKSCGRVADLTVIRYQRFDYPIRFDQNLNEFFHATLVKQFGSLGINIRSLPGSKDFKDERLFIKDVVPGSPADKCGLIQPMDQIVAVNGQSISHLTKDESLTLLKQNSKEVHLTFLREAEMGSQDDDLDEPNQGTVEERIKTHQRRLGEGFEVQHCQVIAEHLMSMVKEHSDPSTGALKYIVDQVPKIRHNQQPQGRPTNLINAYPLESGDNLLEIDGIQTWNMDPFNPAFSRFYGPQFDKRRHITVVYSRNNRNSHSHSILKHEQDELQGPEFSMNPMFGKIHGGPSDPTNKPARASRSHKETPLHVYKPDKYNEITRSEFNDTTASMVHRSQSNERLVKPKHNNATTPFKEATHSRSEQHIYSYARNPHISDPTTQGPSKANERQLSNNERINASGDPTNESPENDYDELRRSKMTEYQEIFPDVELSSIYSKTETAADSRANANELDLSSVNSRGEGTLEADNSVMFVEASWEPEASLCTVMKIEGESMGLKISQINIEDGSPAIVVQEIMEGGEAEKADIMAPNDRIVQVMNYDTSKCLGKDFVNLMNHLHKGPITIGVRKFIPLRYHQIQGSDLIEQDNEEDEADGSEYDSEFDEDELEDDERHDNITEESMKEDKSDKPLLKTANKKMFALLGNEAKPDVRNIGRSVKSQSDSELENDQFDGHKIKQEKRKEYQILDNTVSTNIDVSFDAPSNKVAYSHSKSGSEKMANIRERDPSRVNNNHLTYRVTSASSVNQSRANESPGTTIVQDELSELNGSQQPGTIRNEPEDNSTLSQITKWPDELVKNIVIEKKSEQRMGMGLVSPHDKERLIPFHNAGMLVRTITSDGLVGQDGRLQEGDYLVAINGYELGSVPTELQPIMQTAVTDPRFVNAVELHYVPGEEADYFLQTGNIISLNSEASTLRESLHSANAEEAYMEEVPSSQERINEQPENVAESDAPDFSTNTFVSPYASSVQSQEPSFEQMTLGPKRFVEIVKAENESLGISIVDYAAIGIIVQSVREGSAADLKGEDRIYPWDRLTSVNGTDLTRVTREEAITIIKQCRSHLRFIVQSIMFLNDDRNTNGDHGSVES